MINILFAFLVVHATAKSTEFIGTFDDFKTDIAVLFGAQKVKSEAEPKLSDLDVFEVTEGRVG